MQKYLASMEGAVLSGKLCAEAINKEYSKTPQNVSSWDLHYSNLKIHLKLFEKFNFSTRSSIWDMPKRNPKMG